MTKKPSANEAHQKLIARRAELLTMQVELKAKLDSIAYAAAIGDSMAVKQLAEAEDALAAARREVELIDSAMAESARRVTSEQIDANAEALKQAKIEALAALAKVEPLFTKAVDAVVQLEALRLELKGVDQEAFTACLGAARTGRSEDLIHLATNARETLDLLVQQAASRWRIGLQARDEDVALARDKTVTRIRSVERRLVEVVRQRLEDALKPKPEFDGQVWAELVQVERRAGF
ncbi:MAG: hypothetical protein QM581_06540 [Pseudomonas sp.]